MSSKLLLASALLLLVLTLAQRSSSIKVDLLRDEYERLGTKADFYDEEYQNGMSTHHELVNGGCQNLLKRWRRRALAIDTRGTCASVCTEEDCQGTCVIIIPGSGDQKLSDIKMAKRISSIQGCFVEGSQKGKP